MTTSAAAVVPTALKWCSDTGGVMSRSGVQIARLCDEGVVIRNMKNGSEIKYEIEIDNSILLWAYGNREQQTSAPLSLLSLTANSSRSGSPTAVELQTEETETVVLVKGGLVTCVGVENISFSIPIEGHRANRVITHLNTIVCLHLELPTLLMSFVTIFGNRESGSVDRTQTLPLPTMLENENNIEISTWDMSPDTTTVAAIVNDFFLLWRLDVLCCVKQLSIDTSIGNVKIRCSNLDVVACGGGFDAFKIRLRDADVIARKEIKRKQQEAHLAENDESDIDAPSIVRSGSYNSLTSTTLTSAMSVRSGRTMASETFSRGISMSGSQAHALLPNDPMELSISNHPNFNFQIKDHIPAPASSACERERLLFKKLLRVKRKKSFRDTQSDKESLTTDVNFNVEILSKMDICIEEPIKSIHLTSDCVALITSKAVLVSALGMDDEFWYKGDFQDHFSVIECCHSGEAKQGVPVLIGCLSSLYLVTPYHNVSELLSNTFILQSVSCLSSPVGDGTDFSNSILKDIFTDWVRKAISLRDKSSLRHALLSTSKLSAKEQFEVLNSGLSQLGKGDQMFSAHALSEFAVLATDVIQHHEDPSCLYKIRKMQANIRDGSTTKVPQLSTANEPVVGLLVPKSLEIPKRLQCYAASSVDDFIDMCVDAVINYGISTLVVVLNNRGVLQHDFLEWITNTAAMGGFQTSDFDLSNRTTKHEFPPDLVCSAMSVVAAELLLQGQYKKGVFLLKRVSTTHEITSWDTSLHKLIVETVNAELRSAFCDDDKTDECPHINISENDKETHNFLLTIDKLIARQNDDPIQGLHTTTVYPTSYNPVPASYHPDTLDRQNSLNDHNLPHEVEPGIISDFAISYKRRSTSTGSNSRGSENQIIKNCGLAMSWAALWDDKTRLVMMLDCLFSKRFSDDEICSYLKEFIKTESDYNIACDWCVCHSSSNILHKILSQFGSQFGIKTCCGKPDLPYTIKRVLNLYGANGLGGDGETSFTNVTDGFKISCEKGLLKQINSAFVFGSSTMSHIVRQPLPSILAMNDNSIWNEIIKNRPNGVTTRTLLHAYSRCNGSRFEISLMSEAVSLGLNPNTDRKLPPITLNDVIVASSNPLQGLVVLSYCEYSLSECLSSNEESMHYLTESALLHSLRGSPMLLAAIFPEAAVGVCRGSGLHSDDTTGADCLPGTLDVSTSESDTTLYSAVRMSYSEIVKLTPALERADNTPLPTSSETALAEDDRYTSLTLASDMTTPELLIPAVYSLNVEYYLERNRPVEAFQHVLVKHSRGFNSSTFSLSGDELEASDVKKYSEKACVVALGDCQNGELTSAVVVFLEKLGAVDVGKKISILILCLRRIIKFGLKGENLTEKEVEGYFQVLVMDDNNIDNKERILSLLEASTALMETIGEPEDEERTIPNQHDFDSALTLAESHIDKKHSRKCRSSLGLPKSPVTLWWLVTTYSNIFNLGRYTSHLRSYIASGDWSSFLCEAEYLGMSSAEVTNLVASATTKYTGAKSHIILALKAEDENTDICGSDVSVSGTQVGMFFKSLLSATTMNPEEGSDFLLRVAVEHQIPILSVYATVIYENTSCQRCLLAWLCCIENKVNDNNLPYPSHKNEKQVATDVSDRIKRMCFPESVFSNQITSIQRGIAIFLPSSALLYCVMIAHATHQRRWPHIASSVSSMRDTHKMPWEEETCNTVIKNLITCSKPHLSLKLLSQLESVTGPYIYHVCSSLIIKTTLKAIPGEQGPTWLLNCDTPQDAIEALCRLGLFKEATAVASSVGRVSLEIDVCQIIHFVINNLMHCPALINSSVGLVSMLQQAGSISNIGVDYENSSILGSCVLLVRYQLRCDYNNPDQNIQSEIESDGCCCAVVAAAALVTGLLNSKLNIIASLDLLTSSLGSVRLEGENDETLRSLRQLGISLKSSVVSSLFSFVDKMEVLSEICVFVISKIVENIEPETVSKVNTTIQLLFPQITFNDPLCIVKSLSPVGRCILGDAMNLSGIPVSVLNLEQAPKACPSSTTTSLNATLTHTDDEIIKIARRLSQCSSTSEAFSLLPSAIVGKLVTTGAIEDLEFIKNGNHFTGTIALLGGISTLTTTAKGSKECLKITTLVKAAKHTETNTMFLSKLNGIQILKRCLRWTETVERGWSWHAGIELGEEIVSSFELNTNEIAIGITQLLVESCYRELATTCVHTDKSTVMISDYMSAPQTERENETVRVTNSSDLLSTMTREVFDESIGESLYEDDGDIEIQFKTKKSHPLSRRDSVGGSFSGMPQAAYSVGIQRSHLHEMASLCGSAGEATLAAVILKELILIKSKLLNIHKEYKAQTSTKWVRSVIINPYVAALVHASWLCELDYDHRQISDLKQLLMEAVDDCCQLNELAAVAPLLMCFPDLRFINHVVPLLVSRESVDSILGVFQSAPHAWGESQCLLYSYMQRKSESCSRTRDIFCKMLSTFGMHNEVADVLECQGHMKVKEALEAYRSSYRPSKKSSRRLGKPRRGEDITGLLRQQGIYLSRAALLFQEASVQYLKAKSCASARRCLNIADLVGLQERHPIGDLQVVGISTTGARSVLAELKSFKDALIVANCYDINSGSEWMFAIYNQVVMNHSKVYWEDYSANMPYNAVLFHEIVQMYKNEKHTKKQADMLRFILQDCNDKIFAEEALKKKNL